MEGVCQEAMSLAGFLHLGKLIFLYDDNGITIEGSTSLSFNSENTALKYEACGWHVQCIDGHNHEQIDAAIREAREAINQPSLIIARTHIGYGSPKYQDTAAAHGSPLNEEEVQAVRENLGWEAGPFEIPEKVQVYFRSSVDCGRRACSAWKQEFQAWREEDPERAGLWDRMMERRLPEDLERCYPAFEPGTQIPLRTASASALKGIAPHVPHLVGGSADLAPSTLQSLAEFGSIAPGQFAGANLHFGVREHAMGGILNGLALHGGFTPFGSTFLVFSDYMRPSIRLAAIMGLPVIYVFTHDSILMGEDGPTHQAVEHLASLRAMPNLWLVRPCDPAEAPYAWELALRRNEGPTAIVVSKWEAPVVDRTKPGFAPAEGVCRGGYILSSGSKSIPRLILISTGAEMQFVLEAQTLLEEEGIPTRIVSMACMESFLQQDESYQDHVLPRSLKKRVVIEAGSRQLWEWAIGDEGESSRIEQFYKSIPWRVIAKEFGYTSESNLWIAKNLL